MPCSTLDAFKAGTRRSVTRKVVDEAALSVGGRMARNWHRDIVKNRTLGQRVSDTVAKAVGSWPFIIAQSVLVAIWVALNLIGWVRHWDPYPFILLNLLFSVQAAYTAPVIMMSQNRQAERDRAQAQADYETNVAAESEIEAVQQALARIEEQHLRKIVTLIEGMGGTTAEAGLDPGSGSEQPQT
jgi:uncharacterized membrane protein